MRIFQKFSVVAGVLGFLISCKHHEVVKDVQAPTVDFTVPRNGTYIHHTVQLQATATDNVSVKKIELYVDNVLLTDAMDKTVSFLWDTKTITDGNHALKAIAYDEENNNSEVKIMINVMNTLVTLSVSPNFITSSSNYYAFVSDRTGTTLMYKELQNGKDMPFETPETFQDSAFTINYFLRDNSPYYYSRILTNYALENLAHRSAGSVRGKDMDVPSDLAKVLGEVQHESCRAVA